MHGATIGLYLHIPFCQTRCSYCDFNTYAGLNGLMGRYLAALRQEIAMTAEWAGRLPVETIFFGGGTPSLAPAGEIAAVLRAVAESFLLDPAAEVTLEANPGTVTREHLAELRRAGVNRLSFGVQSFDDGLLQAMTRLHSAAEAVDAYRAARAAGFDDVNLDLIYGWPRQPLAQWQDSLRRAIELEPEHLSAYALTVEADTPLARSVELGRVPLPDPDLAADMYLWAEERLVAAGYRHYEISNWARPGRACRHNLVYWRNQPYLGCGAGAHSFFGGRRFANEALPRRYLAAVERGERPEASAETIDRRLEMAETMILALRLDEGIAYDRFTARFGVDPRAVYRAELEELVELGLLRLNPDALRLTDRGRLLANQAFIRFLSDVRA